MCNFSFKSCISNSECFLTVSFALTSTSCKVWFSSTKLWCFNSVLSSCSLIIASSELIEATFCLSSSFYFKRSSKSIKCTLSLYSFNFDISFFNSSIWIINVSISFTCYSVWLSPSEFLVTVGTTWLYYTGILSGIYNFLEICISLYVFSYKIFFWQSLSLQVSLGW